MATTTAARGRAVTAGGRLGLAQADVWKPVWHQTAAIPKARNTATGDTAGGGRRGTGNRAGSRGLRGTLGRTFGEALGRELALLALLAGHLGESSVTLEDNTDILKVR